MSPAAKSYNPPVDSHRVSAEYRMSRPGPSLPPLIDPVASGLLDEDVGNQPGND